MKRSNAAYVAKVGLLALLYVAGGKLGLALAAVQKNVSVVWPATGIALAAIPLFGYRLWPGIWMGAFLVNFSTGVPFAVASGIAAGNTFEALVGAYLLHRIVGFRSSLERLQDVLGLVGLAAGFSTTVSATIGVTSLALGGVVSWAAFGSLWWQWWLGDAMGALVVAPVLLTWSSTPTAVEKEPWRFTEAVTWLVALVAVSLVVLSGWLVTRIHRYPLEYAIFPFLIWSALRLGPRGAATGSVVVSSLAIFGTARGLGPFIRETTGASLVLLQLFMAVAALTGIVLGAVVTGSTKRFDGLREGEDRYRDLVEHSQDLMCTHDLDGRILSVNPWAEKTLGYAPADILKMNVRDFVAPEVRHEFDQYVAAIRRDGAAQGLMLIQTRAGEKRIWEYANTLRTEGVPAPIVRGMAHDITERMRAEKELKRALSLLNATLESTADALLVVDQTRRIVSFNRKFADMWRIPHSVLASRDDTEALNFLLEQLEDPEGFLKKVRALYDDPEVESFDVLRLKDGRTFERYSMLQRVGAKSVGRVWSFRDVTERMRAEKALRQSQQDYEGLVSSVDGIVWEADARTLRFSFVSQQAERLLRYPLERWLAEPTFWRDHIHPDNREVAVAICEAATRAKRSHDFEYRMTASDGRTVWLRDIVTVVVEHDQAVKLRGVMVDITDWKRAEATRQALYRASLQIQEPLGLQERLDRLLETAHTVLDLDRLNILLADPQGWWLEGVATLGTKEPAEAMRVPIGPEGGA